MIEIEGLTKNFGRIAAVSGIDLRVHKGEVLGFLGPNGAGKSTTMKMIAGYLSPSAGRVSICGHDVENDTIAAQSKLGYLPEGAPAYGDMTPRQFLNFIAQVRGFYGSEAKAKAADAATKTELEPVLEQPIDTLSKGFKRRVGLAQAILHDPPVLVLVGSLLGFLWHNRPPAKIFMGDSGAYFVGSSYGRRKLYPVVSPNKSVEGAAGGVAGSVIGAIIARFTFFPELTMVDAVVTALLLGIIGQIGDLFESLLKRSFGVKDSGGIVPGHGGILDRLDSILFAAPAAFYYAVFIFMRR
jgi:ABC-type transport system involved in cytochrome c biogenesis ATPase subunit